MRRPQGEARWKPRLRNQACYRQPQAPCECRHREEMKKRPCSMSHKPSPAAPHVSRRARAKTSEPPDPAPRWSGFERWRSQSAIALPLPRFSIAPAIRCDATGPLPIRDSALLPPRRALPSQVTAAPSSRNADPTESIRSQGMTFRSGGQPKPTVYCRRRFKNCPAFEVNSPLGEDWLSVAGRLQNRSPLSMVLPISWPMTCEARVVPPCAGIKLCQFAEGEERLEGS